MAPQSSSSTSTEAALVIERVFDAPVELVWKAWTEPDQVKKWWGPRAFTCPTAEIDFRVGGKSLNAMQSPDWNDGKPIWSTGVYKEIVPLKRIVTTDSFADEHGNVVSSTEYGMEDLPEEMMITVTFEDLGGRTKLTLRHEGLTPEHKEGAGGGWSESLDKLAELLAAA